MKYQLRIVTSSRRKFISYEDYIIFSLRDNMLRNFKVGIDSSVEEHRNISLYDLLDLEIPKEFNPSLRAILKELANG